MKNNFSYLVIYLIFLRVSVSGHTSSFKCSQIYQPFPLMSYLVFTSDALAIIVLMISLYPLIPESIPMDYFSFE